MSYPHILSKDSDWIIFLHGPGGNSDIYYKLSEDKLIASAQKL